MLCTFWSGNLRTEWTRIHSKAVTAGQEAHLRRGKGGGEGPVSGWGHLSKKQVIGSRVKRLFQVFTALNFKMSGVYGQARLGSTLIFNNSALIARSGTGGQSVHG